MVDSFQTNVIARALHILGVILWIGGVSFVTLILLPAIQKFKNPEERINFFEEIESKFATQAKFTTLLTGATGFYMLYSMNLWNRYVMISYWWVHAMTFVWFLFTLLLFVLEPLFLHDWFIQKAKSNPDRTFLVAKNLHRFLLTISVITILGAALGSHGLLFNP